MAIGTYAFKNKTLRTMAWMLDQVGYLFSQPPSIKKINPHLVLVVRLDQLGDIVQTLPFLDGLKSSFADIQIDFLTTSLGAEFIKLARPDVTPLVWNCPWFDRSRKPQQTSSALISSLREKKYDAIFDLRGDIRLIWMLRKAHPQHLIGYGATGGGFFLDIEPVWDSSSPAIEKNLTLLKSVGGTSLGSVPRMAVGTRNQPGRRLSLAIHPDAGTKAKRWGAEKFAEVINQLTSHLEANVVLVGLNRSIGEEIASRVKGPLDNQMGKTDLKGLINILGECDGLLSNDSGPAHLAAALSKPVWIIWSGTADSSLWSPRGEIVTLFEHPVDCAPCSLAECPVLGHPCLTEISAKEVSEKIISHFHPSIMPVKS